MTQLIFWNHFELIDFTLHSSIEALGAIAALLMAFMPLQVLFGKTKPAYIFISIGFLQMGLWDLFHSFYKIGDGFVFTHSIALLAGGLLFSLIIIPWKLKLETAKKYSLRLLSIGPRTKKEIISRLKKRNITEALIHRLVGDLESKGIINDLEFSKEWIDSRLRFRPRGKKLIEIELRGKGIEEEIIQSAVKEKEDELDERRIADRLIEKKLSTGTHAEKNIKARLFRFLVSKGIEEEIAEEVVAERLGSRDA